MQALTRMVTVVIEDYYHMTTRDENMNWMKLAHLLWVFSPNLRVIFCKSTLTLEFLLASSNVYTKGK